MTGQFRHDCPTNRDVGGTANWFGGAGIYDFTGEIRSMPEGLPLCPAVRAFGFSVGRGRLPRLLQDLQLLKALALPSLRCSGRSPVEGKV